MTRSRATTTAPMFPMRSVVLGAFVPTFLFEVGVGAILPVVAISARDLGASLTVAGLVTGLLPLGKILMDLPAGALATRVGDRAAMLMAGGLATAAFIGIALVPNLWGLIIGVLVLGGSSAVFYLARQAHLTEITPPLQRARVMSTMAGIHRIGLFLGPFVGAGIIAVTSVSGVYWLGTVTTLMAVAVLAIVQDEAPDPTAPRGVAGMRARRAARQEARRGAPRQTTILEMARQHRKMLLTLGVAIMLIAAVRGARQSALPLWGEYLGFDPEVTSLIFGVSGALDMLLFYPAGKVMDRFGRLWVAVPSMLMMAISLALLPVAHTVISVTIVAALLGIANGVGSGVVVTVGADVAPAAGRATFLGVWRFVRDTGEAAGPLIISAGIALGSLAAAIWVTSTLGVASSAALLRWMPRYTEHANLTTRRQAAAAAAAAAAALAAEDTAVAPPS